MRVVHFSDCHIGYFSYGRLASDGLYVREHDVMSTFARLIDATITLRPDAVLIAGDLFHFSHPSPPSVLCAFSNLERLAKALPDSEIVLACGNHEISKKNTAPSVCRVFESLGVHVADRASMRFYFDTLNLSVLAVPDAPGLGRPAFEPDPRARFNAAVIHGEASGARQAQAWNRASLTDITPNEIGYDRWHYVAYGHFHQREAIAANASYSGSPDYTSSNPWGELGTPKGLIERDLDTGIETFHELAPSRRFLDLSPLYAQGLGVEELEGRIADALESCEPDDAVVRLKVLGVTRDVRRGLSEKTIRSVRRRALSLQLSYEPPAAVQAVSVTGAPLGRRRFSDVEERARVFCMSDARSVPSDVDKAALGDLAVKYIREAAAKEADSPEQESKLANQLTASLATHEAA